MGSGPFSFNLLQTAADTKYHHRIVHMTANEDYYGGLPMLSRFEVHSYDAQDGILGALRTGEVTAASDLNGTDASEIDSHNYDIAAQPINSGVYAMFNSTTPILKDKVVRQALALGTDTNALRSKFSTKVPPLDLPFISGQLYGPDVPQPAPTDQAKAMALLEQGGWTLTDGVRKKGDQRLELTIATTKNAQYEKALESLAGQWRKLGVIVHTNIVNTADPSMNFVQDILQSRNYDVLLYELSIGADPDVYAYWHSSQGNERGYNFSNYSNVTADDALASARSRLEPELRNAKYKTFARQWIDDVPAIGLYQPVAQYVYNKHVRSIDASTKLISSYDRYANILDWSVNQKSVYKTP
jgi:peptide/nickel transport system substrate-binding protein